MRKLAVVALVCAALAACANQDSRAGSASGKAAPVAPRPAALADVPAVKSAQVDDELRPVTTSGTPTPAPAPTPQAPTLIRGVAVETMCAAGYTYARLETRDGELWAAVNRSRVERGAILTIVPDIVMENFESKTLNRRFDRIVFGRLAGTRARGATIFAPTPETAASPVGASGVTAGNVRPVSNRSMPIGEAMPGGWRVSELWASRSNLSNKDVIVRGTVVKFLPGIMGRNWIHLRDGSGTAQAGDNDITATTEDTASVGDVVTLRGVVKIDQDLGAGYTYKVIIVDGRVER